MLHHLLSRFGPSPKTTLVRPSKTYTATHVHLGSEGYRTRSILRVSAPMLVSSRVWQVMQLTASYLYRGSRNFAAMSGLVLAKKSIILFGPSPDSKAKPVRWHPVTISIWAMARIFGS